MAAPTILDIDTILQASEIAGGYICVDRAKKNALYGGFVEPLLPEKIQFVRKRVQHRYDKTQIATNAQSAITITAVPSNQYNIQAFVNDPTYGNISLGSYTKDGTDTTTALLASHIASALSANGYGYVVTPSLNSVIITARTGLGSTINGSNLSVSATTSTEVKAKAFFGFPTRVSTGTVYTTTVVDPTLGTITLAVYTQQAGDTTDAIFNTNFLASLNANVYGYTTELYFTTGFYIVAPTGYGASINGNNATIARGPSSQLADFLGGVYEKGIIPNTLTQFSGGFSAIEDATLRDTANLLWNLLGKYGVRALNNLFGGGTVIHFSTGSGAIVNVSWDKAQFIVGDASQSITAGSVTPNDGDMSITFPYKIMPKSELITYQLQPVPLAPSGDFYFIPSYGNNSTTYTFSAPLTEGYALDFQFARVVSGGSSGAVDIPGAVIGLQSLPLTIATTSDTLIVPQLGTFVFALINGLPYANDPSYITQSGNVLNASNIGGWTAGQNVIIFYNP